LFFLGKKNDVDTNREEEEEEEEKKKKETSYTVDKRLLIHYRISNARLSRKMSPFILNVCIRLSK